MRIECRRSAYFSFSLILWVQNRAQNEAEQTSLIRVKQTALELVVGGGGNVRSRCYRFAENNILSVEKNRRFIALRPATSIYSSRINKTERKKN